VLAAAGAAQSARQAQISADIARYKAQIATLAHQYKGRSGRYNSGDSSKRATAEEALNYLYDGFTLQEGRDNAAAERQRIAAEAKASHTAVRNAQHHAAKPDARQHCGGAAAAASAAAPRGGAEADQPPDDEEDAQLPDGVDQRYFSASPAQKAFNAWAQGEARHSRGGENVGGGFWRFAPTHFVQLGGAADTVGVEPQVVYDPQRTYGCERGVCPVHKWDGAHALGTAGLTRTCEPSHTRARGAHARAILCILTYPTVLRVCLFFASGPRRISVVYHDEWGCSHWLCCGLCQKELKELNLSSSRTRASCASQRRRGESRSSRMTSTRRSSGAAPRTLWC